jgi:hypothetical protein
MDEEKQEPEKENADDEQEKPNQKFKRIAGERGKAIGKLYLKLISMPPQPSYDVSEIDAKKLIAFIKKFHQEFLNSYEPIAEGKKVSKCKKIEEDNIF